MLSLILSVLMFIVGMSFLYVGCQLLKLSIEMTLHDLFHEHHVAAIMGAGCTIVLFTFVLGGGVGCLSIAYDAYTAS